MTADTNDGSILYTWFFTPPVNGKGHWYLYGSNGSSDAFLNSGTYTRHSAAAAASGTKDVTAGLSKR
jgi:hypothetical protein